MQMCEGGYYGYDIADNNLAYERNSHCSSGDWNHRIPAKEAALMSE